MSVQAESLEVLEKADVAPAQARAIVRAIQIEIAGATDTLATKHDLALLRQDLHNEMTDLRTWVQTEMTDLRTKLQTEMAKLRAELRAEMSALSSALGGEMSELRGELRAEIHASVSGVARQMYGALLGQMAVLLGFAYFFATHIR